MEKEKYNLFVETLRFLELCQLYLKNGKISPRDYYNMTGIKIQFVNSVISEENFLFNDSKELKCYLERIFINHYSISDSTEKVMSC